MFSNAKVTNESNFEVSRVGCKWIDVAVSPLDLKEKVVYLYCNLLLEHKCKTTSCYLQNCPIVNERIDRDKIGYDPQNV
jgi:hypothetical protein